MSPLLTIGSTVMCPHGGRAVLSTANTQATVRGQAVLLQTDRHTIAGCPFFIGTVASPCISIQWMTGATQAKVNQTPVLLQTSVGLCLSAAQAPQGVALIVQTQTDALGV